MGQKEKSEARKPSRSSEEEGLQNAAYALKLFETEGKLK